MNQNGWLLGDWGKEALGNETFISDDDHIIYGRWLFSSGVKGTFVTLVNIGLSILRTKRSGKTPVHMLPPT